LGKYFYPLKEMFTGEKYPLGKYLNTILTFHLSIHLGYRDRFYW